MLINRDMSTLLLSYGEVIDSGLTVAICSTDYYPEINRLY